METINNITGIIHKDRFSVNSIRETFEWKWIFCLVIVWTIFVSPTFAQEKVSEIVIVVCNEEQHMGKLLYVTETELVLWQSKEIYDPNRLNDFVKLLHYSEIDRIVIDKKGQFWTGAGYGLVIGGGIGAIAGIVRQDDKDDYLSWHLNSNRRALKGGLMIGVPSALIGGIIGAVLSKDEDFNLQKDHNIYQELVPKLKKKSIFPFIPPPELQAFMEQRGQELPKFYSE